MLDLLLLYLNGFISILIEKIHYYYRKSPLFHALGRILTDRKAPKGLPNLTNYEKVSDRCYRILGLNPGSHTLQGTNTYLIGLTEKKFLIDTGEDITSSEYTDLLINTILPMTNTSTITSILLTHGHGDHQGGVIKIIEECKKRNMIIPKVYKCNIKNGDFPSKGFDSIDINNDDVFKVDDNTNIKAVFTPGHTDDHMVFIIEEDNAILTGDTILGCGTTVFDNLYDYMNSLNKIKQLMICQSSDHNTIPIIKIYPGHGPIISQDIIAKVDEYIIHRLKRECQILISLQTIYHTNKNSLTKGYISTWELVPKIYGNIPIYVKISAHWNLSHHLNKLLKEKRVINSFPDLWKINDFHDYSNELASLHDEKLVGVHSTK